MNVNHFIKKFKAIPDACWCTGFYEKNGRRCATGHCGYDGLCNPTREAHAFWALFEKIETIPSLVNDGEHPDYQQRTPKARILAALQDIKGGQVRILNQTAVRDHALACSKQIRGGKFSRVSESFINEIQLEVEALIRSFEAKYPAKTHADVHGTGFATGQLFEKLGPILDNAIARLIQRRIEQHPSVGSTLQGK